MVVSFLTPHGSKIATTVAILSPALPQGESWIPKMVPSTFFSLLLPPWGLTPLQIIKNFAKALFYCFPLEGEQANDCNGSCTSWAVGGRKNQSHQGVYDYHKKEIGTRFFFFKKPRECSGIQLSPWGRAGDKIATVVAIWEPWGVEKSTSSRVLRLSQKLQQKKFLK